MAEALRTKFQEHLSCSICLEQLQDPKVLPCLHSFCHGCIAKLDMTGNILSCPECRATLEVPEPPDVSFLPSNFFAKNLLATLLLAAEPDSRNIVCENCDSGEQPEMRCQQCTRYLCKFCTEAHRRSRDTKTHTLSTLDEMRESNVPVIAETLRCPKHEDEIVKLYCKTCEETICRDCTIVDHRRHDYVFARDVSQKKKDELLQLVGEVKQKRSEMSDCLAYLKKTEENVHRSNESTVQKINQHFENLGSFVENKKNEYLEKATAFKSAKIKQLHLQQEELELILGSCDSSIEFTEQAFENGSDVQILNLTKYMAQCLESLKNKNTEDHPRSSDDQDESTRELTEHTNLCDQMVQVNLVDSVNESTIEYTANFSPSGECLIVDKECEIIIQRKGNLSAEENGCKITISPSFEGVAVKDVSVVDNSDGSRAVRFRPTHAGKLTFVAYMNGVRVLCVPKTVKKEYNIRNDCRIGDRVFESGVHTWNINIDHSDCGWGARVDIDVGVIDCANSSVVSLHCFVKSGSDESVYLTLDMEGKKLELRPSWKAKATKFDLEFEKVSPYFRSDCDECKLTVTADNWCFVRYT